MAVDDRRTVSPSFSPGAWLYRFAYFGYVFITPVFLQYIMRAPMPADFTTFSAVPGANLFGKNVAEAEISTFPGNDIGALNCEACNLPGYFKWKSFVQIKEEDRYNSHLSHAGIALFPTMFMSTDFKDWIVVADSFGQTGYIGSASDVSDVETIGCPSTMVTQEGLDTNFSLSQHSGEHGHLQLVACIVQTFEKVEHLKKQFADGGDSPFEEHCIAIGSLCGPACHDALGASSDSCDDSLGSVPLNFMVSKATESAGRAAGHDLSLSHKVSIKTRTKGTRALANCEDCLERCADRNWEDHCREQDEKKVNCETWKCKIPAEEIGASPPKDCREHWECKRMRSEGLQIKDLYIEAVISGEDAPAAIGGFYGVIFSGTHLKANNPSQRNTKPAGNWQIIHAPLVHQELHGDTNITDSVMVDPKWCYGQPGFTYMVACLTAERTYVADPGTAILGPPFNDRCVAVGGICGGTCGSAGSTKTEAKSHCPGFSHSHEDDSTPTFLSHGRSERSSPLGPDGRTFTIPFEDLVGDIQPLRSSDWKVGGPMFHIFIVCMTMSFVVTATTYFPANFTSYYPTHTWEELESHGYIMQEFCAIVAFGVSKGEDKFFVFRNWIGKLSAVPQFQESEEAVFQHGGTSVAKWVDLFADEGHREGARRMYAAWADFLMLEPSVAFIEAWAKNLRYIVWDEANKASAFDLGLAGKDGKLRPILPLSPAQAQVIWPAPSAGQQAKKNLTTPAGYKGVPLTEEQLAGLIRFRDVYDALPRSMKIPTDIKVSSDCIMTYPVPYAGNQVYLIYAARGNPEHESRRELKTRRLVMYHWGCLSATGVLADQPDAGAHLGSLNELTTVAREEPLLERQQPVVASIASSGTRNSMTESSAASIEEEVRMAVDRELMDEESQPNVPYLEHLQRRVDEQSLWEKCRFCYGKIVGIEKDVFLLDDVSAAFHELMQSQRFREVTGCGYPRQTTEKVWAIRSKHRKKKVFTVSDQKNRQHRIISVPKRLLEPYFGVRGKAGAMNFAVDLLRNRNWIYPAPMAQEAVRTYEASQNSLDQTVVFDSPDEELEGPPKPRRYCLFGIFDVRHQPHNDFWNHCLPAFFYHNSLSFDYEVNSDVALVQAPQSFASIRIVDDYLDVNNGLLFNMMNIIRNRVGGVTSCGTNGVWLIDAVQTWKEYEYEYFDSRSKIEDTASSHRQFIAGKRSVYVHQVVATGIAKLNAAYLGATQRWAEGAVQIFWIHFAIDRTKSLWALLAFVLSIYAFLFFSYYTPSWPYFWCCPPKGWCLRKTPFFGPVTEPWTGTPDADWPLNPAAYITYPSQQVCEAAASWYMTSSSSNWSDQAAGASFHDVVRLIDFAFWWAIILLSCAAILSIFSKTGFLPRFVRNVIMFENCTYFWSSPTVFFWVALSAYMVLWNDTPFHFRVFDWMLLTFLMQATKYVMQQKMKNVGNCDEMSIWRSQQMFFVASPLHVMSLIQGTAAAYSIWKIGVDKSFWSATDHGQEVVNLVKLWTSTILGMCVLCLIVIVAAAVFYPPVGSAQVMSFLLLFIMVVTVWTPVLDIWGQLSVVNEWRIEKIQFGGWKDCCKDSFRWCRKSSAQCMFFGRSKSYMLRWAVDLGLPIAFLASLGGAEPLQWLAVYALAGGAMRV